MKLPSPNRISSGFTLIEVLIVSGLLAIIFISVSSLFMTSLASGLRTTLWQELRSEGTFALSQMAYMLRNSSSIIGLCSGGTNTISFDNPDATKSQFFTVAGSHGNQLVVETIDDTISNFSNVPTSYLTSDETDFQLHGATYFDCHTAGEQPYVTISFQLLKETESISDVTQQFRRTVFLRNSP